MSNAAHVAPHLAAPITRPMVLDLGLWTTATHRIQVAHISICRFRTRLTYGGNTCATRQTGRYSYRPAAAMAGDVELNPEPDWTPPLASPSVILAYQVNARSKKKNQLGDLRACAPVLVRHDIVAITETWLNNTVADSEVTLGLEDYTWFRRDRELLGGGLACAVRSSLSPLRLPDPDVVEMLLVRLQGATVTVAICYRAPDDDAALQRMTGALADLAASDGRLIVMGDFNFPEFT